ncbi:MAG: lamin tail domain-containing protein [Nannocystaceae bacterium]|nr:lamin tail domain-containing protein [bacterium]
MNKTRLTSTRALASLCLLAAACSDDSARGGGAGECVASLLPGDLVISELMINPDGSDQGNEWIEIYNPTGEEIELSGALLRFRRQNGEGEKLHRIEDLTVGAGDYIVLGDREPDALPDHVDYGYGDDLGQGLSNSDGEVSIGCGTSAVDIASYIFGKQGPQFEAPDNASWTFDGTREPDAISNDDVSSWCDAVSIYQPEVPGDDPIPAALGTPGAPNDPCYSERPTECNDAGTARAVDPPGPGDIVITEYMADPRGPLDEDGKATVSDDNGEWIEIYVDADVDLNGLALSKLGDEDDPYIIGSVDCIPATRGSYYVFARSSNPAVNGGLPTVDFEFDFSLTNASDNGTGLSVSWGGEILDSVTWTSSPTGAASQLDPMFLGADRNDESAFCEAEFPYGGGDLGTPGEANPRCPFPGSCIEDRNRRAAVAPSAGDLWINEFMADPSAVGDGDGEWFEVFAAADFDLNGVEFGRADEIEETIDEDACLPVQAGDHVLFARNAVTAENGGLPEAAYEVGFSLINDSGGALYLAFGGEVLDAISWSSTEPGFARALNPDVAGPDANDDEANWCDATQPYASGDFGTPTAENSACGGTPVGTCNDAGEMRETVAPSPGDLVITEWIPNPDAVGDTDGEWFEVLVTADVDLNGLELGDDPENPDDTLPSTGDCISVSAGTRVVFARNADAMLNGGVEDAIEASFSLTNSASTLFVGHGGAVLDQISYSASATGSSTAVAPGFEDPANNDDEGNHCTSTTPYGDGDNGTPGAENVCE